MYKDIEVKLNEKFDKIWLKMVGGDNITLNKALFELKLFVKSFIFKHFISKKEMEEVMENLKKHCDQVLSILNCGKYRYRLEKNMNKINKFLII